MPNYTLDCKKVEVGDFSLVDGTISNWTEVKVLKNSVNIQLALPTRTKFHEAGKKFPFITALQEGTLTGNFSATSLAPDALAKFIDGTVSTADGVKTFGMGDTQVKEKFQALRFTTRDNFVMVVSKASIIAGLNFQLMDNQVPLLPIEFEPADTGFSNVKPVTWTEPAA